MDDVKNVLLVTNSATDEEINQVKESFTQAAKKGLRIKLSLVHVIPSLPTCYFNIPSMSQLAEQYYSEAKNCLTTAGEKLGVAKKDQWLITGRAKTEVVRLTEKIGAQFILASSSSHQELYNAFSSSKQKRPAQIQNIDTIVTSNF